LINERHASLKTRRVKVTSPLQRFASIHDPLANLFHLPRQEMTSADFRELRTAAMDAWRDIANLQDA
jgi:putative transposase